MIKSVYDGSIANTTRLLTEDEWRCLGVTQSRGWVHYLLHKPEPHILLFRRPLGTDPQTGKASTYKILTVQIKKGTSSQMVNVTCTNMNGDVLVAFDFTASTKVP